MQGLWAARVSQAEVLGICVTERTSGIPFASCWQQQATGGRVRRTLQHGYDLSGGGSGEYIGGCVRMGANGLGWKTGAGGVDNRVLPLCGLSITAIAPCGLGR
jgi:hypothetical protein